MNFPFFLPVSKTDKPLGDDTFQNQSLNMSKTHLLTDLFVDAL